MIGKSEWANIQKSSTAVKISTEWFLYQDALAKRLRKILNKLILVFLVLLFGFFWVFLFICLFWFFFFFWELFNIKLVLRDWKPSFSHQASVSVNQSCFPLGLLTVILTFKYGPCCLLVTGSHISAYFHFFMPLVHRSLSSP